MITAGFGPRPGTTTERKETVMLTGYQCEIVAYVAYGGFYCRECMAKATSLLSVEKADMGLSHAGEFEPVIRYSLDEYTGERTWEDAEERWYEIRRRHPVLAEAVARKNASASYDNQDAPWRVIDRLAEKRPYTEHCESCWAELG